MGTTTATTKRSSSASILLFTLAVPLLDGLAAAHAAIDRSAVLRRHRLNVDAIIPADVFSVGNGAFAFSVDATGLQSLNATYTLSPSFDLQTLSDWGFHSLPYSQEDPTEALTRFKFAEYSTPTGAHSHRLARYPSNQNVSSAMAAWLHGNPHRVNLVQAALRWDDGLGRSSPLSASELSGLNASLDLETGLFSSSYTLTQSNGAGAVNVAIVSAAHPDADMLSTQMSCAPIRGTTTCPLALRLAFPYARGGNPSASDWDPRDDTAHTSAVLWNSSALLSGTFAIDRTLDADSYVAVCNWSASDPMVMERSGPHTFGIRFMTLAPRSSVNVSLVCLFSPRNAAYPVGASSSWLIAKAAFTRQFITQPQPAPLPSADSVAAAARASWASYWSTGAFVDLAGGAPPGTPNAARALELERRVVLSQYLTRVHSAGSTPPQETGLLCNSWGGKWHSEMRYWHAGHFPLWGRPEFLARSDAYFDDLMPNASAMASWEGYDGARWPKMTAPVANRTPSGIDVPWMGQPYSPADQYGLLVWESVNTINPFLVWNQPHMIWLAEAQRRYANASTGQTGELAVLNALAPQVFATARFLASFPYRNETDGFYYLGPPIMGGEEEGDFRGVNTPSFERTYFAWALDTANQWNAALGNPSNSTWDAIASSFVPLPLDPASPSLYTFNLNSSCCFVGTADPSCPADRFHKPQCNPRQNHPLVIGLMGMIDGRARGDRYGVNATTANATIAAVASEWDWGSATDGAAIWGWDFPLVALSQTRLAWSPDAIVDMLLMPVLKNSWFKNGHVFQRDSLPAYMPANGGLLLAIAAMAGGTSGSPMNYFPPAWNARSEGFLVPFL